MFVAMLSFPRTVLSLKQSTEPMQVHSWPYPLEAHLRLPVAQQGAKMYSGWFVFWKWYLYLMGLAMLKGVEAFSSHELKLTEPPFCRSPYPSWFAFISTCISVIDQQADEE